MLGYVPGIGAALQRVILGGSEIGPATVINFYAAHTSIIPISLVVLMTWHFWRVRTAGGVVVPPGPGDQPEADAEYVQADPHLFLREYAVTLIVIAFVLVIAILFGAPLGEPANAGVSPNPAKAPWYFLGFQELLLHFHPLFAVFIVPLLIAVAVINVPFLKYDGEQSGTWFLSASGRRTAAVAATTALLATPLWILADEFVVGPGGWLPNSSPIISNGLLPFMALLAGVAALHKWAATQRLRALLGKHWTWSPRISTTCTP